MAKKGKKLTLKEEKFLDALFGAAKGNASEAARIAGYGNTAGSARQLGYRLLTKVHIQQALAQRAGQQRKVEIADADERDTILTEIARKVGARVQDRISAVKELNKCTGRHSMKHLHEGKLTLEEAVAQSRQ